jgi:hypothetical protein
MATVAGGEDRGIVRWRPGGSRGGGLVEAHPTHLAMADKPQ